MCVCCSRIILIFPEELAVFFLLISLLLRAHPVPKLTSLQELLCDVIKKKNKKNQMSQKSRDCKQKTNQNCSVLTQYYSKKGYLGALLCFCISF